MSMRALNTKKPMPHHNIKIWEQNNMDLHHGTRVGREEATGIRFEGHELRSEALNKIHWNREGTNAKFTDRIIDIERLHLQLEQVLKQVEEQIISVSEAKKTIENAHASKFPFTVACKRSLDVREARRDLELLDDFVNNALREESHSLESASQQLRDKGMELWNKLCTLKDVQDKVKSDMKGKGIAAREDKQLRAMNLYSSDITMKHMPTDPPPSIVSEKQWADRSISNKQEAEKEIHRSQDLVCEAFSLIRHTENDILQHSENTKQCMRRRIQQVESARDLLRNQKEQLLEELRKMSNEIVELEKTIDSTKAPLKLVHTRLETRKWYPPMEACNDGPRSALTEELSQLESFKRNLAEKLQVARLSINNLQMQLGQVQRDLEKKDQTLQVENKSLEIHTHPLVGEQIFHWVQPQEVSEISPLTEGANSFNSEEQHYLEHRLHSKRLKPRDSLTIGMRNSMPSIYSEQLYDVSRARPRVQLPDVVQFPSNSALLDASDLLKPVSSSHSDLRKQDSKIVLSQ